MPTKSQLIKKPDAEAHEKEIKELEEIIGRAEKKLEDFRAQIQAKREGGTIQAAQTSFKNYLEQLHSQRNELNTEAGRIRAERQPLYAKVDELREEQTRAKPRIKFFDQGEINQHIRGLQEKQEHTSLTLNEEKRIVAEIRELEQSKPLVAQYHERQQQLDKIQEELRSLKAKLSDVTSKAQEATSKINELSEQRKESIDKHKAELPILVEQRRDLENKISEYRTKKNELITAFRVQDREYNEQQNLIKHIKFVTEMKKKLKEQEERRKFAEERQKEEQENKPHPYGEEISKCDAYLQYLGGFVAKQPEAEVSATQAFAGTLEEGMVIIDKKEKSAQVASQWAVGGAGPKQKKRRDKKPTAAAPTLHISVDMLSFLSSQGIKVPTTAEDVPATIEAIQTIRNKWEKAESKPAEKKEEKKSEAKSVDLPEEEDFPVPQSSEVVVTHGLFLAEEAEERKDRPYTAPDSRATRGGRGRGGRGDRGRGARRARAPRGDRGTREPVAPVPEEEPQAAE